MSRDGGRDIRVRSRHGSWLDEYGSVAVRDQSVTHGINVSSR
jgi:hypothetical protein